MSAPRHEFDYIARVRAGVGDDPRVPLGIGDDAALIRVPPPGECLSTVDMLMEGVDFLMPPATPEQIGRKALAVNLSDIAAMAGQPIACLISLALPRKGGFELGSRIFDAIRALAREYDVAIAGGDTNTWNGPIVLSITVLGEPTGGGPVMRSGARPEDWIMATGSFGGSIAGRQFDFAPRISEAQILHRTVALHSMIDVSDGLAADLAHLLDASGTGAILNEFAIPVAPAARQTADGQSPLQHALSDGEDFELLFTVSPKDGRKLLEAPPFGTPLAHLGEIVAGSERRLRRLDGTMIPLPDAGWKHAFDPPSAGLP